MVITCGLPAMLFPVEDNGGNAVSCPRNPLALCHCDHDCIACIKASICEHRTKVIVKDTL